MLVALSTVSVYALMYLGIPIVSHFYGPLEYGKYSTAFGAVMLGAALTTGRLELAILIPPEEEAALKIMQTCLCLGILVAAAIGFGMLSFHLLYQQPLANLDFLFRLDTIALLAFYLIFISIHETLIYWANRNRYFKLLSIARFVRFGTALGLALAFAFFVKSFTWLLLSDIIGLMISIGVLAKVAHSNIGQSLWQFKVQEMVATAHQYRAFPLFSMPSAFINKALNQAPVFLLNYYFGAVNAGYYSLAARLLSAPTTVISESVASVFRGEVRQGSYYALRMFKQLLLRLLLIALPLYSALYFGGSTLVHWIFSVDWDGVSVYLKLLIVPLAFQFVFSPLTFVLFYYQKQKLELGIQAVFLGLLMLSVTFTRHFYPSDSALLICLGANAALRLVVECAAAYQVLQHRAAQDGIPNL